MMENEDEARAVLFVDILGFAALTEKYQFRVEEHKDERLGFCGMSTTEIQGQFNRFNRILDQRALDEAMYGGIQAMLFSDCAFLVFKKSVPGEIPAVRAVAIARKLMRHFITERVPVRMGIGKGTFYDIEYSTNTNADSFLVVKSRFFGTAVVRAHGAERCGGKGMRIFLDESVDEDLPHVGRILRVPETLNHVKWELNYLHEPRPISDERTVELCDAELYENVNRMKTPEMAPAVLLQYEQTVDALNRMRKNYGRESYANKGS